VPSGWSATTLGRLIALQRGFDLPKVRRRPGPYPVVSSGGVSGWHDSGPVPGPGLAIGRAANLGVPVWSDGDYWPLNTTLFVSDFRGNEPRFVYYLLQQLDLSGYNSGSVQPMLNRNYVSAVPLVVPGRTEQRFIAQTLRSLDDKIEANRRLLTLSLELAAASVRSAAADPSASHLPVAALARFVNGGAYTQNATGAGRMVIRIAELNSGPGGSTVYTDLEVPDDKTARAGDLLMSWSGSLDIYRWTRDEAIINQHIFKVIPKDLPAWLVHDRLKAVMPIFQSIAKDKATTMGHIQRGHLEGTTVPMPPLEEIKRLDAQLGPLWHRLLLAERQIHTLTALRDALLPELLSGRIRVPEAGQAVESALAGLTGRTQTARHDANARRGRGR
jgi:type I restriction enzyme S subunit